MMGSENNDKLSKFENEDENILTQKIQSQKNVILEYKNWLKMLSNILSNNDEFEYISQVKKVI